MDLIFRLDSMLRACGGKTGSTAHVTSKLECGYVTEKSKPFTRTVSSESVRINFLGSEVGLDFRVRFALNNT
jgi:hypothetical protein